MRYYARFKVQEYRRILSALNRLKRSAPAIADRMCRLGAIEYKNLVIRAISTNNFVGTVPDLKESYKSWKAKHGFPTKIGILKHDLLNNIQAFKVPKGWFGGVEPSTSDSGGKNWRLQGPSKLIVKYAIWLEEGNRRGRRDYQAPRPIFMPIANQYAQNEYMKHLDDARGRLLRLWS